jgi:hypothetical protein
MTTYYLGASKDGAILARSSTRTDFAYAAIAAGKHKAGEVVRAQQSCWSGTAHAAVANFSNGYRHDAGNGVEVVAVRVVTGAEFRQATKEA